ncbi:hypothetical protein EJ04DRAFT_507915 [Polyplosphaeria fusca]|uniref:DUF7704 domain-containing protein n=1 Tax=Polyplosphaeria fusca TaxID=682080 RepID=A0A9P4RBD9_9PLEO|nr:hypothetical protein EJ04DRAFT_507915 [Polyplosphaeria fusca]
MASELYIPLPYRLLLLYIEPLFAFNGALLCLFSPALFLQTFTTASYRADHQVMFDQLAATYILFAFNQAVVLRITKDLQVWKAIILGILMCDIVHLYAAWNVMGTEAFVNPSFWRWEEVVNFSLLYGPGVLRIAFLLEIGVKRNGGKKRQ